MMANGYIRGALEHAAAAWLPATPKTNVEILEREMRAAARIITGCIRSAPHLGIMAEAGILPVAERRSALAPRVLAKAAVLPADDPLHALVVADPRSDLASQRVASGRSRGLTRAGSLMEPLMPERPPSWTPGAAVRFSLNIGAALARGPATATMMKETALLHLAALPQDATWVWTDGSATGSVTNGGAGALIIYPDEDRHELRTPVGSLCSSFRAEMTALRSALDHLLQAPRDLTDPVVICTESKSALAALHEGPRAQRTRQGAEVWTRLLTITDEGIRMQWVPSHCGIPGNEATDALAGDGPPWRKMTPRSTSPPFTDDDLPGETPCGQGEEGYSGRTRGATG